MGDAQERAADRLAAALTSVILPVAQTSDRAVSTAASVEEVDVVVELGALAREIVEHNRRVMACEPADWSELADRLRALARECQRHVTMDINDAGTGGSGSNRNWYVDSEPLCKPQRRVQTS